MPGKKWHSIKKPELYEKLRDKGLSKENAAIVSNSVAKKERRRRKK